MVKLRAGRYLLFVLLILGMWQFGSGAWILLKAELAQHLIARAWQQTLVRQAPVKPWPWADTWPVARLQWRDEIDLYVLDGASAAALPFGPGLQRHGSLLLAAGHRDTHFAFLRRVNRGDRLTLTDMHGEKTVFQVRLRQVVDSRQASLRAAGAAPTLMLVTCYPFEALRAGGPLRFVVTATPQSNLHDPVTI